jgi:redox-sensitive bicupin YhaK (pirin superfamily)
MSGPVDDRDVAGAEESARVVEVREGRSTSLGGLDIVRVLPTKGRRTVGAWCFVDLMIPPESDEPDPMEIGPHPHMGLSTVTWLFEGEALHSDSLGTEQPIRPGQLNLMTAGHGIAHAELGLRDGLKGVQMWIAQPEWTRRGESSFEHHSEMPRFDFGAGEAVVFMGELGDVASPARSDTPLVGADVTFAGGRAALPARTEFEYAVVPLDRALKVEDAIVEPGWLALVPPGVDVLEIDSDGPSRAMVLGGEPFGVPIKMWWNFVARDLDEITRAWRAWQAHDEDRFGPVPSDLDRIDAPTPPWVREGDR